MEREGGVVLDESFLAKVEVYLRYYTVSSFLGVVTFKNETY